MVLVAGCSSFVAGAREQSVRTHRPGAQLTVVADAGPSAAAIGVSRALFAGSDVAVVARDDDRAATLLGAAAAVGLGVPLLVGDDSAVAQEADRLGVRRVLTVGKKTHLRISSLTVPAVPQAVASVTGLRFADADPVEDDAAVRAVAALDPQKPAALRPVHIPPASTAAPHERLVPVHRPQPLDDVVVLASGSPESLAGVATARAAGARVVVTGGTDPRASADAVQALGSARSVVALGADFAGAPDLGWEVDTARTGTQLPGGGQTLFPGRMLVALYGTPGSAALGVLGEQDLDAGIQRARTTAAAYDDLVDRPVVPAFEIIATIATGHPGDDGNYSAESDPEALRPWVEKARDAGIYVVLDLQPGRADFLTQAQRYESLLEEPNVGLALDPEWRLGPSQLPLQEIGSVGVDEVNAVSTWLADLTREHRLPQKLFVVHQFRTGMIDGRERLDTSRPELAVTIHADGQGAPGDKQATWQRVHENLPPGPLHWGWKNFYDEDHPMLSPQQTIDQVDPDPDLVTYQ
nr:hypothetical protein [Petropleomorpha daqingensis]